MDAMLAALEQARAAGQASGTVKATAISARRFDPRGGRLGSRADGLTPHGGRRLASLDGTTIPSLLDALVDVVAAMQKCETRHIANLGNISPRPRGRTHRCLMHWRRLRPPRGSRRATARSSR